MQEIFYQPPGGWVGDLIPFSHKGRFYLFYLHDLRKGKTPDDYGFGTTWNLLITTDGTDVQDMGVVLPTGGFEDPDLSCYTGSVLAGNDGRFHMFYTAQNSENPRFSRDGRPLQYVMHAVSDDLLRWEKRYETLFGADSNLYEPFDWRDPHVYYNSQEGVYHMLLAARRKGASAKNGGCIALCRSQDLWNWEVCEPFYDPAAYLTHECPDLFEWGKWWYLVYSTFSERFVTHYRMGKSPMGPWMAPVEDSFDGRGFYAAKTAELNGERWAFAWVPSKRGGDDEGQWEWGGALVMHKLWQHKDGRLFVSIPPAIQGLFSNRQEALLPGNTVLPEGYQAVLDAGERAASLQLQGLPQCCMLEAEFSFSEEIRSFGIAIRQDEDYADGYFFRLEPFYNRLVFDLWPRRKPGVNQWYLDGHKPFVLELERPYRMAGLKRVQMRLLIQGDICVCYVDNAVALTTRLYNLKGTRWSAFAHDGTVRVSNIRVLTAQE